MPDLDDELAGLRDALHTSVSPPELRKVVEKSRHRSSRRRRQLGAVAAVLVVGATIPLLRTALRPVDDPDATPAAPPATGSALPFSAPFVYNVDFFDSAHGYALRGSCGPENNAECMTQLLVTDDRQHWAVRNLPPSVAHSTGSVTASLVVVGQREVVVGDIFSRGGLRFWSTDSGQTWQQLPATDDEAIDTIPDGGTLRFFCQDQNDCAAKLIVIQPGSGRIATLRTQPPFTHGLPAAVFPVGGQWWAYGLDATGHLRLAVTRDRAATWAVTALPDLPSNAFGITMSARRSVLYASVTGQLPDVKNGLLGIYRSTDDGASWEQTWRATDNTPPRSIGGVAIVTADDTLVIHTEVGQPFISKDGGRTFQPDPKSPAAGYAHETRAGYLVGPTNAESSAYRLSVDGVNWKEFTVG
jgi:hypothetical protein